MAPKSLFAACVRKPRCGDVILAVLLLLCALHVGLAHGGRKGKPAQCSGGRDKVTAQQRPSFPPSAECSPPSFPASLTEELGVFAPVLLSSLPFWANSLPNFFLGALTVVNAGFNAAVAFNSKGKPTFKGSPPRVTDTSAHTLKNKNIAITYAMLRVGEKMNPAMAQYVTGQMAKLGLPTTVTCPTTGPVTSPECVGLKAGDAAVDYAFRKSRWNFLGCQGRQYNCRAFADTTGYKPVNDPYTLKDIHRWQPLFITDGQANFYTQTNDVDKMAKARPFTLTAKQFASFKAPFKKPSMAQYRKQAQAVLDASAALTDEAKMFAEYVDTGVYGAEAVIFYALANKWDLMKTLEFTQFFTLVHDTVLVFSKEKAKYDTVRPQSAIRYLFGDKKVNAWAGVGQGTKKICGFEWVPYTVTHSSSEFPSGVACSAQAFVEWVELFIGTKDINLPYSFKKGCSVVEPGFTPQKDIAGVFKTATDFVAMAEKARLDSGVHFPIATTEGSKLCKGMAAMSYKWLQKYVS